MRWSHNLTVSQELHGTTEKCHSRMLTSRSSETTFDETQRTFPPSPILLLHDSNSSRIKPAHASSLFDQFRSLPTDTTSQLLVHSHVRHLPRQCQIEITPIISITTSSGSITLVLTNRLFCLLVFIISFIFITGLHCEIVDHAET